VQDLGSNYRKTARGCQGCDPSAVLNFELLKADDWKWFQNLRSGSKVPLKRDYISNLKKINVCIKRSPIEKARHTWGM
jgi:hypothetical protein